jgi:hypothetical protein
MGSVAPYYDSYKSITITLTSLSNGGYRCSLVQDNSTNQYVDVLLGGSIQTGTATGGSIDIYIYASYDGYKYSGGVPGTDSQISWGSGGTSYDGAYQLKAIANIAVNSSDDNTDVIWGPLSVAQQFGGVLPRYWGVVVCNNTGGSLHATGTNNAIRYIGIKYMYA